MDILNEQTGQIVQRKIPLTTEIKRLKVIICTLFRSSRFDSETLKLFYKTSKVFKFFVCLVKLKKINKFYFVKCLIKKKPNSEYELENDFRNLNFYAIDSGDTIIARAS